jgi:hypothetical protein
MSCHVLMRRSCQSWPDEEVISENDVAPCGAVITLVKKMCCVIKKKY